MTKQSLPEILLGEQLVFSLLGRALYTYDDHGWFQSLANDDVFRDIPFSANQPDTQAGQTALIAWSGEQRDGMSDEAFDALRADFTRLFVATGPTYTPPWESVHFNDERLNFEAQTVQVRAWYRRYGLEPEKLHSEPDDHIALELTFVGHLAGLAFAANQEKDLQSVDEIFTAQQNFCEEHLFRWAPSWCDRVAEHAHTLFYQGIALVAKGALREVERLTK